MAEILVQHDRNIPVCRQQVEYVERKGIGHPDTICDALMESVVRLQNKLDNSWVDVRDDCCR